MAIAFGKDQFVFAGGQVEALLPFALCFAAGAMITVAATDLIPDSRQSGRPFLMTLMTALGFTFMTLLDVALG